MPFSPKCYEKNTILSGFRNLEFPRAPKLGRMGIRGAGNAPGFYPRVDGLREVSIFFDTHGFTWKVRELFCLAGGLHAAHVHAKDTPMIRDLDDLLLVEQRIHAVLEGLHERGDAAAGFDAVPLHDALGLDLREGLPRLDVRIDRHLDARFSFDCLKPEAIVGKPVLCPVVHDAEQRRLVQLLKLFKHAQSLYHMFYQVWLKFSPRPLPSAQSGQPALQG